MTLREAADDFRAQNKSIQRMEDELEMLRDSIVPATARMTGMPSGHGEPGDPTGSIVIRIEELAEKISKARADLEPVYVQICGCIAHMARSKHEAEILFRRMVKGEPYSFIAADVKYSQQYCRNVVSRYGQNEYV